MKLVLKLAGVLLLVLVILVGVGVYYLGSGVKKAVETLGPQYTQTPVQLGSVDISLWSGSGSLKNLVVGNPAGFDTANAFSLGEIALVVDTKTITGDPILINSLRISHRKSPLSRVKKAPIFSSYKEILSRQ